MGQYYKPVNLDKEEFLTSWTYDNGAKLMEHSWIRNNFVAAVEHLVSPEGNWHKSRIVWAGDYGDEGLYLDAYSEKEESDNLYSYASENFKEVKPRKRYDPRLKFIVNHTKKQFVDRGQLQKDKESWVIHPLSILTCNGNGRGGGDFHPTTKNQEEFIGLWAGDVISTEFEHPGSEYAEIKPNFEE